MAHVTQHGYDDFFRGVRKRERKKEKERER